MRTYQQMSDEAGAKVSSAVALAGGRFRAADARPRGDPNLRRRRKMERQAKLYNRRKRER